MDPTSVVSLLIALYNYALPLLPAQYAAGATIIASFLVSLASLVVFIWSHTSRKPAAGSRWYPLFTTLQRIGLDSKKDKLK